MAAYIVRRMLATMPVMLTVAVVVFLLLHLAPGDPGGDHRRRSMRRPDDIERIRASSGSTSRSWCGSRNGSGGWSQGDLGVSIF